MIHNHPIPLCKAFLVLRQITEDPKTLDTSLVGLVMGYHNRNFPAGSPMSFFARLTDGHGSYQVEVQLRDEEGKVVWRDGPSKPWVFSDPLRYYDLKFNMHAVFPQPGAYDFVLTANGEEIARQRFHVSLTPQPAEK